MYIVIVKPRINVMRSELWTDFQSYITKDADLSNGVTLHLQMKVVGKEEYHLVLSAKNEILLQEVLTSIEKKADISVTPVIQLT